MEIKVCMGSSCYLKGSYQLVQELQKRQEQGQQFDLSGSLCFGKCAEGLCAQVEGELVTHLSSQNMQPVFSKIEGRGRE